MFSLKTFSIALCFLSFEILNAQSYKILVYSLAYSRSHLISNARIADALAADGHDVTLFEMEGIIDPFAQNVTKNPQTKVLKVGGLLSKDIDPEGFVKNFLGKMFEDKWMHISALENLFFHDFFYMLGEAFIKTHFDVIERLRREKFDVYIGEQLSLFGSGLSHVLGIPVHVLVSSCPLQSHTTHMLGLPFPPEYVPNVFGIDKSDKMSLLQKIHNFYAIFTEKVTFEYGVRTLNTLFRSKFGSDFRNIEEIVGGSPIVLVNVNEFLEFPRPLFSNILYIGGLGMSNAKKLKDPFKSVAEKSPKGFIFFSLGSIVNSTYMDKRFFENVLQTFAEFPEFQFILKLDEKDAHSKELAQNFSNVFVTSWAPQVDLIAHPNIRLFVTHGGYGSLQEAALYGVPIISMGVFGDQYRNGRVAERNGWGLTFDKKLLLKGNAEFKEAISRVLTEQRFSNSAKRIATIMKTMPWKAEERLNKMFRFLEANGGQFPELQSESLNLKPLAFYNIDMFLVLSALITTIIVGIYAATKFIIRILRHLFLPATLSDQKIKSQ